MSVVDHEQPEPGHKGRAGGAPADGSPLSHPGVCRSTTQYGRPCQNPAQPGSEWCWSHAPENAEQRRRNSRAGGVAAHSPATLEIGELKDELRAFAWDVKENKVAPGVGSTLVQIYNTVIRAIETGRKVREQEELEQRIEALEMGRDGSSARPAA